LLINLSLKGIYLDFIVIKINKKLRDENDDKAIK